MSGTLEPSFLESVFGFIFFFQRSCKVLSFMLYYFGLTVFVWHLLKAAQFTGSFDRFFRAERNLFAFYLILGWRK